MVNNTRRASLIERINGAAQTTGDFAKVRQAMLSYVTNKLVAAATDPDPLLRTDLNPTQRARAEIQWMLNNVGPAAASSAIDFAIAACKISSNARVREMTNNTAWTNDPTRNVQMVLNWEAGDGAPSFSNVLRQFLLPRYAYLDFDIIVDPRHRVDMECGYPKFITPIMYRYMYDRDDVASRVVDLYADEIHCNEPCIYDDEDETVTTPFEEDIKTLIDDRNLLQMIYRMDKLAGVGHYGALLFGIDDGKELDQPVDGIDPFGKPTDDPMFSQSGMRAPPQRQLLFMRPFDEYLSFIQQYETNVNSPRYGQPVMYNLVFLDMTIDAAGASIGTRLNRRVHWTRVAHIFSDSQQSSLVFGIPRQQRCFNRLLDLRKIKGADAEGMWKTGFGGIAFEVDPQFIADDPDFDRDAFKEESREFSEGLQKSIVLEGIKANQLKPEVSDPCPHVKIHMEAIAMHRNVPIRIFLGAEEAKLAGAEERLTWNKRLGRYIRMYVNPYVMRPIIDRLIALRVVRPPKNNRYCIDWPDLNTPTDEDKANLSLKWTQALAQYVSTGMIHLIPPMDYLTLFLGLKPADAMRIIAEVEKLGGWQMLMKVDPAGTALKEASVKAGTSSGGRNTADKQTEGMSS